MECANVKLVVFAAILIVVRIVTQIHDLLLHVLVEPSSCFDPDVLHVLHLGLQIGVLQVLFQALCVSF